MNKYFIILHINSLYLIYFHIVASLQKNMQIVKRFFLFSDGDWEIGFLVLFIFYIMQKKVLKINSF